MGGEGCALQREEHGRGPGYRLNPGKRLDRLWSCGLKADVELNPSSAIWASDSPFGLQFLFLKTNKQTSQTL